MTCADSNQTCVQNGACATLTPQAVHPHPSAGAIARIAAVPGTLDVHHVVLPPPATQPGDLVVVGVLVDQNSVGAMPPGWTYAGAADNSNAVFYRVAQADDTSAVYTFDVAPDVSGGSFLMLVYRGVGAVLPGTSSVAPPYDFAGVVRAPSGSVVLGLRAGDHPWCDPTGGLAHAVASVGWAAWDLPTTNGQAADVPLLADKTTTHFTSASPSSNRTIRAKPRTGGNYDYL